MKGLSAQQRHILLVLSRDMKNGALLHGESPSDAASLSRTLRRLKARGLVERYSHHYKVTRGTALWWRLTEAGCETVKSGIPNLTVGGAQ